MELTNGIQISEKTILESLKKITNQIYKLLPMREENIDWETPLSTIIEELSGMSKLLKGEKNEYILFTLLCKLEGLFSLIEEKDFFSYRRTIFECLNLLSSMKEEVSVLCQD